MQGTLPAYLPTYLNTDGLPKDSPRKGEWERENVCGVYYFYIDLCNFCAI